MKKVFDFRGSHVKKIPLQGLLCLLVLCLSLPVFAQQENKTININVKDATVKEVLEIIKKHDYRLVYSTTVIDACKKKVTMNLKKATVAQVLDEAFKATDLVYKVDKNLITIKEVQKDKSIVAKGIVKDEKGEPIPGVTVIIKGTITGTATDANGKFQIKVPENSVLIFSFIGMETETVLVESDAPVTVVMKEMVNEMEEVVITGFQTVKKRESTSSIVTLKAEDFIEPVGTSIDQMLQGKVPGMSVMQMTSTVGAAPKIRIRGSSTIIGNREPVWVLDGVVLEDPVQLDATELNSMDRVNLIGNAISGLNPEDIDRIDVLKDASATALYGTKAANGVIVITTKRGKMGAPSIRYSTAMSFVERPSYDGLFMMNSKDRIEVSQEMHERGLEFIGFTPKNVGYEGLLQQYWDGNISTNDFYSGVKKLKEMNTDWFDLLFRNSFSHSHTFSVSGANERTDYYFSAGYSNQRGSQLQERGERFSFMSNVGFKVSDRFRVNASLGASISTTDRPTVDLFQYAYTTSRAIPAYNADGTYAFYDKSIIDGATVKEPLSYNVFNELEHSGSVNKIRSVNTNITLDYKLTSWLNANAILSYNTASTEAESYYDERTYYVSELRGLPYGYDKSKLTESQLDSWKKYNCKLPFGGVLESSNESNDSFMVRGSLNMNKLFNEVHSISFSAGLDIKTTHAKGYSKTDYGYLPERGKKFLELENISEYPKAVETMLGLLPIVKDNTNNNFSYYASFSYCYKGKYIFSANMRGEASNKLGDDKSARFLPIWSVSGRWNLTDEYFMQPLENVISNLGIRSSYGIQANVTDAHNPNMVIGLGTLDTKSEEYKATLASLPNHGLRWEKTYSFNLGIDFDLFKGKLSGAFEYYQKKSRDQLLSVEVTSTNGAKIVTINGGDLMNKGWDLSLSATPIKTKDFQWGLTFNTGKVYNEVANMADYVPTYSDYLSGSIVKNGYALNSFYSYRFGGLNEKGYPVFLGVEDHDEDGNVTVATREQAFASAMVYSGRREPNVSGGLTTNFRYKRIAVNVMFTLSLGAKVRLNDLYEGDNFKLPYPHQNMSTDFLNRWKKPGDEKYTNIPVLTDEYLSIANQVDNKTNIMDAVASNYWQMYNNCDMRVVSGNFMRCRSISMSYSLSDNIVKKLYLKAVSFTLGVSNPFVIKAKGLQGRDPEQVTLGSGTIPPQQTYSFSMNVTF